MAEDSGGPGLAKRARLELEGGDSKSLLLTALQKLATGVAGVVEENRTAYKSAPSVLDFISFNNQYGVRRMFRAMPMYAECMSSLGVATRKEMEGCWKARFREEEVREEVDELLHAEEGFDGFLAEVEEDLKREETKLAAPHVIEEGKKLPLDLALVNSRTGEANKLESHWGLQDDRQTLFVLMRHFA